MNDRIRFSYKDAHYSILSAYPDLVKQEIILQRRILEDFIFQNPDFSTALGPIQFESVPEIVRRMINASEQTGVGPMAAVAGAIAQFAGEKAVEAGDRNVIIDNGGDIYLSCSQTVTVGLYAGSGPGACNLSEKLAMRIDPAKMPTGICSSSGTMGHSLSFGNCDLATVIAPDTALADAAATYACNQVKTHDDIQKTLHLIMQIPEIMGVIIIKKDRIGIAGDIPELVTRNKVKS